MLAVLKWAPWVAVGLLAAVLGIAGGMLKARASERDAARARELQAEAALESEKGTLKQCLVQVDSFGQTLADERGRCQRSVEGANREADVLRGIIARCPGSAAAAERLNHLNDLYPETQP